MEVRSKTNYEVKNMIGLVQTLDLFMECNDEELSPAQVLAIGTAEKEYQDVLKKISSLKAKDVKNLQGNQSITTVSSESLDCNLKSNQDVRRSARPTQISQTSVAKAVPQMIVPTTTTGQSFVGLSRLTPLLAKSQLIIQNKIPTTTPAASYKLLLDTRTGLIIGTLPNDTQAIITGCGPTTNVCQAPAVALVPLQTSNQIPVQKNVPLTGNVGVTSLLTSATSVTQKAEAEKRHGEKLKSLEKTNKPSETIEKTPLKSSNTSIQESTAISDVEGKSKEFNQEKMLVGTSSVESQLRIPSQYPSLTIKAIPQRSATLSVLQTKKQELDKTMKEVLQETTSGLVKWMFEHGLFHIEQYCLVHRSTKMQLIFDVRHERDHSGGYKWQCVTCNRVLPIQHRSFFENLGYGLLTMLQIIYYWACNEDVQKVLQETKVSACFLRSVYSLLRSICSCKVKTLMKLGGADTRPVEVNISLLGETCMYAPQLYFGCIFERGSGMVALRAFTTKSEAFVEEFIGGFVSPSSTINTDKSLKLPSSFLTKHNYRHISTNDLGSVILNARAYIQERVLPMFGNVIKQLQMETIQSFLSELMWREKFGTNPYNAFNNILLHIKQHYGTGTSLLKANQQTLQMPVVSVTAQPSTLKSVAPSVETVIETVQQPKESDDGTSQGLISLDDYYYAWQEGEGSNETSDKEQPGYKFKCYVCKKLFDNNIKIMRHLFAHIESSKQKNLDLSDVTQCKHCFREFETPYIMQCHVEDVHLKESKTLTCRICDRAFHDKKMLITHMHQIHVAAEMPYSCEVCKYRCSMYRKLIDHFHQVHSGTNFIQCHYCLKVFSVKFSCVQQLGWTNNFWTHIYKHQTKSLSRKCTACCLTFVGQTEMKNHRLNDHISFWKKNGVSNFPSNEKSANIYMTEPPRKKKGKFSRGKLAKSVSSNILKPAGSILNYELSQSLQFNTTEAVKCIECKGDMEFPDHFMKYLCCSQCRYATNCAKAFTNHMILEHSSIRKRKETPNMFSVCLPSEMFCVCGFTHTLGNKMANHLSLCGKRSCYPSAESAENAILTAELGCKSLNVIETNSVHFNPNQSNEDMNLSNEELCERNPFNNARKSEIQEDNPSMLNILGLMRNPKKRRHDHMNETSPDSEDSALEEILGKERLTKGSVKSPVNVESQERST